MSQAAERTPRELPAPARDPWIGDLFDPGVHTGSLALDAADPDALPAAEAALSAGFAPRRRREFAAGRQCARRLLAALGAGEPLLLVGPHRAPRWPEGVVGSIAHGAGLCVVAVAWRGALVGLGVDVESDEPLAARVRRRVCTDDEARRLAGLDDDAAGRAAKLAFAAKEAIYKCVHPLLQEPLGLRAVEVDVDPAAGRFRARALAEAGPRAAALVDVLDGRLALRGGRVVAGATLRAASLRAAPACAT